MDTNRRWVISIGWWFAVIEEKTRLLANRATCRARARVGYCGPCTTHVAVRRALRLSEQPTFKKVKIVENIIIYQLKKLKFFLDKFCVRCGRSELRDRHDTLPVPRLRAAAEIRRKKFRKPRVLAELAWLNGLHLIFYTSCTSMKWLSRRKKFHTSLSTPW